MTPVEGGAEERRRPAAWKRLVAVLFGVVLAAVACELGTRWLLFGQHPLAQSWGGPFKQAQYYTHPLDSDHWKLRWLFANTGVRRDPLGQDSVLGWRGDYVGPDYRNRFEGEVRGRTPVLLYGDSFARCHTSREDCFEGLLEGSPLAGEYALLNFGAGGFGLDQILVMQELTLDRYVDRDPVVIVSLLVDNDLDRLPLHFRHWPKPQLGVVDGELTRVGPPILPPAEYVAANPPRPRSYCGLYLLRRSGLFPFSFFDGLTDRKEQVANIQELTPVVLGELHERLEERGVRYAFLLFLGRRALSREYPETWRESLVVETLTELGAPFASVRPEFEEELARSERPLRDYFLVGDDHYNPLGNAVAFRTLRRAIEAATGSRGDGEPARRAAD